MDFLTPLIGKRGLNGAWIVEPPPHTPAVAERLQLLPGSTRLVRVQIRPTLAAPDVQIAGPVLKMIGRYIDSIRQRGSVTVVMQRGGILPGSRAHGMHETQTFEVGRVYDLPMIHALRLLNTQPLRYIFEEVAADGTPSRNTPITKDSDVSIRELQEQVQHLLARVAAAEARNASQASTQPKRKLKDALGDADGQE